MTHVRSVPFVLMLIALALIPLAAAADDAPVPPQEAPQRMSLPEGFHVTLFAGEPDVVQPIAFTIDGRGRLWVVECLSYPDWERDDRPGRDRVVILEDQNGDGRFDSRKVFWDKGANLTGIELGFGGVWLCATPNLLFIPDRDGDDVPDARPDVMLEGWDLEAKHNVFNCLKWGPDGWLYGCNGILSESRVGDPETPEDARVPLNCGVWRYHPVRHTFEAVAHGTTNPWGLDFDERGEMFITNCVIEHVFHVIPGAHYKRMFGQDINPHSYGLIESCADHIHWGGGHWTESRGGHGEHDKPGGGHAHAGAMIYLGGNWPARYRNTLFTCNIHGTRVNNDALERHGSGYVAEHRNDFLMAHDPWFRGLELKYGPDGGVYVTDWSDTGECHDYEDIHRENGRIYKITWGKPAGTVIDVDTLDSDGLVSLLSHKNDWYVRQALRRQHELQAAGKLDPRVRTALRSVLDGNADVLHKLRALWGLHVAGGIETDDDLLVLKLLEAPQEEIRGWTVRLAVEDEQASAAVRARFAELAAEDDSQPVRLALASALQRLPVRQRGPIAGALAAHAGDAEDPNLPLMIWYGVEPLVSADADRSVAFIRSAEIPLLREFAARRIASSGGDQPRLAPLVAMLADADDPTRRDVLRGILDTVRGRRDLSSPAGWPSAARAMARSKEADVRETALTLGAIFNDPESIRALRGIAENRQAEVAARERALRTLAQRRDRALVPLLHTLIAEERMASAALKNLAGFDDPRTPGVILRHYASLSPAAKQDAVSTLAARPAYARFLLDRIAEGDVARGDLSAFTARQIAGLGDAQLTARLEQVWGSIRSTSKDKAGEIARLKEMLEPELMKTADAARGRLVFSKTCATCHRLFDDGRAVGPELTGSQRANADYVLENMVDPNAVIGRDYQMTLIATADGRLITGVITQESDATVTVQTANDTVIVPKDEIEERERSPVSMMPEGMLSKLSPQELRDLITYLASPEQVPLANQSEIE